MMISILRPVLLLLALASTISAKSNAISEGFDHAVNDVDETSDETLMEDIHRELDMAWTKKPTPQPVSPTKQPVSPTKQPTRTPTRLPTRVPTKLPTRVPTRLPTRAPTRTPVSPTKHPTRTPTRLPTRYPTRLPTRLPTRYPTRLPTRLPTRYPTRLPTRNPTRFPTRNPTRRPVSPTKQPTRNPTRLPTRNPTRRPVSPTKQPTRYPTRLPTRNPTRRPVSPTKQPTRYPTRLPTRNPTRIPTRLPTRNPTRIPTRLPTRIPTRLPTRIPTRLPTRAPTRIPTRIPTRFPTRIPTKPPTNAPTNKPTMGPTMKPPPACGTILSSDGNDLLLGPYKETTRDPEYFSCNTSEGFWFAKSYYPPSYMYAFHLTKKCEYMFRTPEGNLEWQETRDVNSWFEQAAKLFQRPDNVGYRVSDDNIIFSGLTVPNYETDLISTDISDCPEKYCVKVTGSAIVRKGQSDEIGIASVSSSLPELLYAFSNKEAHEDFYKMLYDAMKSSNKERIFLTNNFVRCGCESFCMDDPVITDDVPYGATCYTEEKCGTRVFQIAYSDDYPNEEKAVWSSTGTTKFMDWFNECATAMYGCSQMLDGIFDTNSDLEFPKTFNYNSWKGSSNVYGLGSTPSSEEPTIAWTCPTEDHSKELSYFGEFARSAQLNKIEEKPLPDNTCPPEIILPPEPPNPPPPIGPKCAELNHAGYCNQMPGATCFAAKASETCAELDLVLVNKTSTYYFDDVAVWSDACLASGVNCKKDAQMDRYQGDLTYEGAPNGYSIYSGGAWMYMIGNRLNNQKSTVEGFIYYTCESWEDAFGAKNFTESAGDRMGLFKNSYGDLFTLQPPREECTSSPSTTPSESPSLSFSPSDAPSQAPTLCSESYLTSENLNIALVVDLSYSTYEKEFSASFDIGDVNGDGKGNTILDAQIVAIQDLLTSIADSESLTNENCEIGLISFETDAHDHGQWKPLNDSGDGFNENLMDYIKSNLRAPTSNSDIFNTNNGFTNFDAALDVTVEYFAKEAPPNRKNLLVFLSDGEPNVRGDGDSEEYCAETTIFWNGDDTVLQCSQLGLEPGEKHTFCRGNDPSCVEFEPLQDCVRGPNQCMNAAAVTQYDSEISALDELKVERLAIGVGDESNVAEGSALWMIDNNPAKDLGVLPLQVLNLEELTEALSSLCILNTEPPTGSPSEAPSDSPTESSAPSVAPSGAPSAGPTDSPTDSPTERPYFVIVTPEPTLTPSESPTGAPTTNPTNSPSSSPTTDEPTTSPSISPSTSPTAAPSDTPTTSPTAAPTDLPSVSPSALPSGSFIPSISPTYSPTTSISPSTSPTVSPTGSPTVEPTASPSVGPTDSPSVSPTDGPTTTPSDSPTYEPTSEPTVSPTSSPSASFAPTFVLPDCYEGPKMVVKDSSSVKMCYYNQDMVQINEMNTEEVVIAINNVWTREVVPEQMRVFVHTNGIDSILDRQEGDGFQCLSDEGNDIDIEGDNEFSVQCFQESEDEPWLAVVDVVITDGIICGSNDVPHPCFPDDGPILESCSWRIVIPCGYEALCTEEPTSSPTTGPTSSPSAGPTAPPTMNPSAQPTANPTASPSDSPTAMVTTGSPSDSPTAQSTPEPSGKLVLLAESEDGDDIFFPPVGPEECPEDVLLVKHKGVTGFADKAVRILSQDSSTVTVEIVQKYTKPTSSITSWYYQYQKDVFSNKCYGDTQVFGQQATEFTIHWWEHNKIALLEFWVADDISNGVLASGDNAVIPDCCHPSEPEGTAVTKFTLEIQCESKCPELIG